MKLYVVITKSYDEIDFIKAFRDKTKADELVKQMTEEAGKNGYWNYGVYAEEVELDDELPTYPKEYSDKLSQCHQYGLCASGMLDNAQSVIASIKCEICPRNKEGEEK